jgi:hypothetical protein
MFANKAQLYLDPKRGPLHSIGYLYLIEPALLKVAGIRTVIMGYGADVRVLTRSRDRYFVRHRSHSFD